MPDPRHGVFETLLVHEGRPVELEAHMERLHTSLAELFPGHEPPLLDLPAMENGSLRITVSPGDDGGLAARTEQRELPPGAFFPDSGNNPPTAPVSLASVIVQGGLGAHKWADRSLLDEAQAGLSGEALPLIVDSDGAALEAARANVFAVRDGALLTPPLDGRILPGVTRMRVLEIAEAMAIDLGEEPLTRNDLISADDVFLTGSVRGIEWVDSLDGTPLGSPGEIGRRLTMELRLAWANAKTAF